MRENNDGALDFVRRGNSVGYGAPPRGFCQGTPRPADVLEQLDHVHQRQALGVAGEAVAAAHAADRADQSGAA